MTPVAWALLYPCTMRSTGTLALLASIGCTLAGSEPRAHDAQLRSSRVESTLNFGVCPTYLCGMNAGISGAISFHLDGFESLDGLTIVEALDPEGAEIELNLDQNQLWAVEANGEELWGEELIEVEIIVENLDTGARTSLYIENYIPEDLESARGVLYPSYEFSFRPHEESDPDLRQPLCGATPWNEGGEGLSDEAESALVIQGEAFDWWGEPADDLDEHLDDAPGWFTIGCESGAYAKKILMGFDINNPEEERPTQAENETLLRMLTARYCRGDIHTIGGVELYWQNEHGDFELPEDEELEIEAVWGTDGALCLNTPRWAPLAEVEADCGPIPSCEGFDLDDHYLVSYLAD